MTRIYRRLPRLDLPNEAYFVSVTTYRSEPWFQHPHAAEALCRLICAERRRSVLLHAFVVMLDHYHLLVTLLGQHRIPQVVGRINSVAARQVNSAVGRHGRIWAKRFYDHVIRNSDDFQDRMTYIHENPREEGLVDAPAHYLYSSAAFWELGSSQWGPMDPP
jgi:REP element-mobilizing transposase RayT